MRAREIPGTNGRSTVRGLKPMQNFKGLCELFLRCGHDGIIFLLAFRAAPLLAYYAVLLLAFTVVPYLAYLVNTGWRCAPDYQVKGQSVPHPPHPCWESCRTGISDTPLAVQPEFHVPAS